MMLLHVKSQVLLIAGSHRIHPRTEDASGVPMPTDGAGFDKPRRALLTTPLSKMTGLLSTRVC
jgi:hypothetical protein